MPCFLRNTSLYLVRKSMMLLQRTHVPSLYDNAKPKIFDRLHWWHKASIIRNILAREKRGWSIVVECRTRNRESPSNPHCYHFKDWAFSFSPWCPSSRSCIYEYLATDSGRNLCEGPSRGNCNIAEFFPEKLSWCRNKQIGQGMKCKTDWLLCYIKTYPSLFF